MSTEAIPHQVTVKPAFEERYRHLLGKRYDEFWQYSTSYITKAVRVNTLKATIQETRKTLERNWTLTPVPWCAEGFWIESRAEEKRYDVGNTPEHFLGQIYIQDPASMIPPLVLMQTPFPEEPVVLDLCASPGSKSTQIAALMQNKGVLVTNDTSAARMQPLGINLQRCGVRNHVLTHMPGQRFKRIEPFADRVLVDAPCSATGTIRRSFSALQMWSARGVQHLAREQRTLLEAGWNALKPGGELVYSTCTLEPEEDEGLISGFLKAHSEADLLPIELDIKRSEAITEWEGEKYDERVSRCLRIYPQDNDTEGFFVARMRKVE